MADLSVGHQHELARFYRFFKTQNERDINDMQQLVYDLHQERVVDAVEDTMYTRENVIEFVGAFMSDLSEQVTMMSRDQLTAQTGKSLAHIATLLSQAQASGIDLEADPAEVDNQTRRDQIVATVSQIQDVAKARKLQGLPSLGGSNPQSYAELHELKEENRKMMDRYQQMQGQVSELLKERSSLSEELELVKNTFKELKSQLGGQSAGATAALEQALNSAKEESERKTYELEALSRDAQRTMNESVQFREMRSIIAKKNAQIKEMRTQLAQYGVADDTPFDD